MRATAALVVFAGHARVLFIGSLLGAAGIGANAHKVVSGGHHTIGQTDPGHQAVIVFFVLSGYLVGGGTLRAWQRGLWTWREYAIQRLTRLWMVLLPALLLTVLLDRVGIALFGFGGIYGGPIGQDSIPRDILSRLDSKTFFGCLLFLQNVFTKTLGSNSPLWTLSYEFWFYIAFPSCLGVASSRLSLRARFVYMALLISIGVLVGPKIISYYFIWLMGASLQLVPKTLTQRVAERLTLPALLLFLAAAGMLLVAQIQVFESDLIEGAAFWVFCYVILHNYAPAKRSLYKGLSNRLSDMSYSVYLTHQPILTFLCAALMSQWMPWSLNVLHLMNFTLVLAAAFCIMYSFYWSFERRTEFVRTALRSFLT